MAEVLGLTWLGVRTERFQAMAAMYREVRAPDGNVYEIAHRKEDG